MEYPTIEFEFLCDRAPQEAPACYALGIFENDKKLDTDHLRQWHFYHVIMPLLEESQFTGKKKHGCFSK